MKSPQEADFDSEEASLIQTAPEAGYGSTSDNSTVVVVEEENRAEEPVSGFTALSDDNSPPRASALRFLGDSTVRTVLLSYFFLALISTSNDVIFALWMFLPIKDGGVGFTVRHLLRRERSSTTRADSSRLRSSLHKSPQHSAQGQSSARCSWYSSSHGCTGALGHS